MRLSELKTGERAVVVKVLGHGGFRKRIVEMGFIKGKTVEVMLNAPLHDPVKYRILGYEISLRHDEARMIEVVSREEAEAIDMSSIATEKVTEKAVEKTVEGATEKETEKEPSADRRLREVAMQRSRTINVALVGNPNCGKTSLFNFALGRTNGWATTLVSP